MPSEQQPLTQSVTLNNGTTMPILGLGTWLSEKGEVAKAIEIALENGYRHVDCAAIYNNQEEIGEVFNRLFNQEKKYKREEVYVTSKLWNTFHSKENVREACVKVLKDLKLEYLDLFLIHWPLSWEYTGSGGDYNLEKPELAFPKDENGKLKGGKVPMIETWQAMEKLVEEGLVKSIGVSNCNMQIILDILTYAKIKPVCNQVECHPYLNQNGLIQGQGDIVTVAYSPLGHVHENSPINDERVKQLAQKYNKTPAQILLKWNIQRNVVVIPKSVKEERIIENSKIFDFNLTNEELEELNNLPKVFRFCDPKNFWNINLFD
ncbi:hypothetical protein ABK040_014588 [Willaertia magna]